MNLKFMERALSEKHKEAGLYVEQTKDDTIALMRTGKMLPIKEFDSRCSCQSVIDAADQYLSEITAGINFERSKVKMAKQPDFEAIKKRTLRNESVRNTALDQCLQVNPDNPLAVAETIKEAFDILKELIGVCREVSYTHIALTQAKAVLAKAKKEYGIK